MQKLIISNIIIMLKIIIMHVLISIKMKMKNYFTLKNAKFYFLKKTKMSL